MGEARAGDANQHQQPTAPSTVTVWNDYICPWAYAARSHTDWLRERGVTIELKAYELHPDLAPEGRPVRPGGRLDAVFDHIATECAADGRAFVKPTRTPNSRHCLELIELVAVHAPEAHQALDAAFAEGYWVDGLDLGSAEVCTALLLEHLPASKVDELAERQSEGEGRRLLDVTREEAHDLGVTATPAWRIGELTVTGLHPPQQFQRWAERLLNR